MFFNWEHFFSNWGQWSKGVSGIWKCFLNWGHFFYNWGHFFQIGGNGGKCVSGIWKCFLIGGIFFNLGAKNYFGIFEKISFFGNYMDPWLQNILLETYLFRSARYQDQPELSSQILKGHSGNISTRIKSQALNDT